MGDYLIKNSHSPQTIYFLKALVGSVLLITESPMHCQGHKRHKIVLTEQMNDKYPGTMDVRAFPIFLEFPITSVMEAILYRKVIFSGVI